MPCIKRNNKNEITSITADNGQPSLLFNSFMSLPFVTDKEQAAKLYAFASKEGMLEDSNLAKDANGEPILVFKNLTNNNIDSVFDVAFEKDKALKGIELGFKTQDNKFKVVDKLPRNLLPNSYSGFMENVMSKGVKLGTKKSNFLIGTEQASKNVQALKNTLDRAKQLETQGIAPQEIESQTGWYKVNGNWLTLLPDVLKSFQIKPKQYDLYKPIKLVDLLTSDGIFNYYPTLERTEVIFFDPQIPNKAYPLPNVSMGTEGFIEPKTGRIWLRNPNLRYEETTRVLAHELTHRLQQSSRLPLGGGLRTVIFEAGLIAGLPANSMSYTQISEAIKNKDRTGLTPNQNKILDDAERLMLSDMFGEGDILYKSYLALYGEIEAELVERALQEPNSSYSKLLNDVLTDRDLKLEDTYKIAGETGAQFSITDQTTFDKLVEALNSFAAFAGTKVVTDPTNLKKLMGEANLLSEPTKEMQNIKAKAIADGTFMKAPNGKKTLLNEVQWLQVRTKAFQSWAGDTVRKNKNGEPEIYFHGSDSIDEIEEFSSVKGNDFNFFTNNLFEATRYTSKNEEGVKPFFIKTTKTFEFVTAPKELQDKIYTEIKKDIDFFYDKLDLSDDMITEIEDYFGTKDKFELIKISLEKWNSDDWRILETWQVQDIIKKEGYDSFITNESDGINVALYEKYNPQIKLADGTNTTFDGTNPNINYLKTPNGIVYGATYKNENGQQEIYINPETLSVNSLIHEFYHPFQTKMREASEKGDVRAKAAIDRFITLAKEQVKETNPQQADSIIAEFERRMNKESIANPSIQLNIIGEKGAERLESAFSTLNTAKTMLQNNATLAEIEAQTNWYVENGQWKYFSKELLATTSPKKQLFKIDKEYTLEDVLESNTLLNIYPQLKNIKVQFYRS